MVFSGGRFPDSTAGTPWPGRDFDSYVTKVPRVANKRGPRGYPRVIGSRRRIPERRGAAHLGAESEVSARRTEHRDHVRITRLRAYHRRAPRDERRCLVTGGRGRDASLTAVANRERKKKKRAHAAPISRRDRSRRGCPADPSILTAPFFRVIFYEFIVQD